MTRFERIMLKDLYESVNGLFAFTFYSRYDIEPEDMFLFINRYENEGLVRYEDDKLYLTREGREIVLKQLVYTGRTEGEALKVPPEFIVTKLEINEPYLPNIMSVSADILKK